MELVIMQNQQAVTSSLQVAEAFERNHRDVLKAIDDLKEGLAQKFADLFWEEAYTHSQNKQEYRQIIMNRDGFTLLAMGFNGNKVLQFKLKYIEAFNEMEKHIKEKQPKLPQTTMEILELMFKATTETNERVEVLEEDIQDIKENRLISTEDKNSIDRMVRRKVALICKEQRLDQEAKSLLFADIGKSIKELFEVPHRGRIKNKDFEQAVDFIGDWEPSSVTKAKINQMKLDI